MFQIELKRIQLAINSGRIDEAYDWLLKSPLREHRDGQRLVDCLAEAFVQRSRTHLDSKRIEDAKADAKKAHRLAGARVDVAETLVEIAEFERALSDEIQRDNSALGRVREQINIGALTLGKQLLPAGPNREGSALAETIQQKQEIAKSIAERIKQANESGDWQKALKIASDASCELRGHRLIAPQIDRLAEEVLNLAEQEFSRGRLDRAVSILSDWNQLQIANRRAENLNSMIGRCWRAKSAIDVGDFAAAEREIGRLDQMMPKTQWIGDTRDRLARMTNELQSLQIGPIGLIDDDPTISRQGVPGSEHQLRATDAEKEAPSGETAFGPCVLRIDGLGGILLLPQDKITIGCLSRSAQYDLALQVNGEREPIAIHRLGDDYFARSLQRFRVGGQWTQKRLLCSGDRIELGNTPNHGRVEFQKPVAASSSARLDLKGARLNQRHIRHIALMADSLVLGSNGSHFPFAGATGPIILFRSADGFAVKQPGNGPAQSLEMGGSVLVSDCRFALSQVSSS